MSNMPHAASATDRQRLEHETAKALTTNLNSGPPATASEARERQNLYERMLALLQHYNAETLHFLLTHATTSIRADICDIILTTPYREVRDPKWLAEYINDVTIVKATILSETDQPIHALPLMHGLALYTDLTPQQDHCYPSRRAEEITAITRVTVHFLESGFGVATGSRPGPSNQYIADPEIRELITTHEKPSAAASIIIQRGITDAEQIAALLATMDTTENPLINGTL